eukprot:jgi/Galph1/1047/GphlegSOOS_G5785.1
MFLNPQTEPKLLKVSRYEKKCNCRNGGSPLKRANRSSVVRLQGLSGDQLRLESGEGNVTNRKQSRPVYLLTKKVFRRKKSRGCLGNSPNEIEEEQVSRVLPEAAFAERDSAKLNGASFEEDTKRVQPQTNQGHFLNTIPLNEEGIEFFFRELSVEKEISGYPHRFRATNPPSKGLDLLYIPTNRMKMFPYQGTSSHLKDWYTIARRWAILKTDVRAPLLLESNREQNVPSDSLKYVYEERAVKNWKQIRERNPQKEKTKVKKQAIGVQAVQGEWSRFLSKNPRLIIVGDVHGCVDELRDLLRLADFRPGDQVIFLGDLVAKGPDSAAVVKIAREIGARSVRGNHDFELIRWWIAQLNGTSSTVSINMEHLKIAQELDREDHEWLFQCPWFIRIPEMGYLLVHAGFVPDVDLLQQNPRLMMNMRSVLPNGIITNRYVAGSPWAAYWKGPEIVVFGHDAYRGLQKFDYAQVRGKTNLVLISSEISFVPKGIDTGCVYGGRLTALLLPENRLISVQARSCYRQRRAR